MISHIAALSRIIADKASLRRRRGRVASATRTRGPHAVPDTDRRRIPADGIGAYADACRRRSEEHTSELQSLMRISYAVFCLKKNRHTNTTHPHTVSRHTTTSIE